MSETPKPDEAARPVCFVLMPIADVAGYEPGHFGRVYEHLLKPAIVAAGYVPVRADDAVKTDYIVVGIIQKIVESAMVLCDFSARNPNVMYELGVRHAFNKPVVLIRDRKTEKIFDIQGLRYAEYDETLRIDAVNRDTLKITTAISETAASGGKDLNSIVQLAGIKTAEVPVGQTISSDTKLLLTALNGLDARLRNFEMSTIEEEDDPPNFIVEGKEVRFSNGDKAASGAELFINGKAVGTLSAMSPTRQAIMVKDFTGRAREIRSRSNESRGLSSVPF
jgi:hypothetical protein